MSEEIDDVKKEEVPSETPSVNEELENESTSIDTEEVEEESDEVESKKTSLQARLDELTEDNRRQKALLEQLMLIGQQSQRGTGVIENVDEDNIDPAVLKRIKAAEQRVNQNFQGMLGGIMEEMDKSAILSSPKANLYKKYQSEVESFRRTMANQGRFFKREEALANVLLDRGLMGSEKPKPKKLVKQQVKPAGVSQSVKETSKKDTKPQTSRDRLAGKSF